MKIIEVNDYEMESWWRWDTKDAFSRWIVCRGDEVKCEPNCFKGRLPDPSFLNLVVFLRDSFNVLEISVLLSFPFLSFPVRNSTIWPHSIFKLYLLPYFSIFVSMYSIKQSLQDQEKSRFGMEICSLGYLCVSHSFPYLRNCCMVMFHFY